MECLHPIQLKSGFVVPCGQCTLCQSKIRSEKSVLVQMHCEFFDRMPLFIGLSYDEDHLPRYCTCGTDQRLDHAPAWSHARFYRKSDMAELKLAMRDDPNAPAYAHKCLVQSLYRHDVSSFLKSYKRVHGLGNDKFTYFGCGEYGQDGDFTNRPHYHLIWFGDSHLERIYDYSVHAAERYLSEFWQNGNVDVNVAEVSGIHYVTKYCLKDNNEFPHGALPPFTISSNGIGNAWLKTPSAERIRQRLLYLYFNRDDIYKYIDLAELDWNDVDQRLYLLKEWLDWLKPQMPDFTVILPSGKKAILPRKLKSKLVGSFQHFSDNPLWLYSELQQFYETDQVLKDYDGKYESFLETRKQHAYSIDCRIKRNKRPLK